MMPGIGFFCWAFGELERFNNVFSGVDGGIDFDKGAVAA